MSIFKLLVSKTLSRSAVCSLALGPGISVLTEGALGSIPSKRPMLVAETEKQRLEREETAGVEREEERSLAGPVAEMRREMVRRADMVEEEGRGPRLLLYTWKAFQPRIALLRSVATRCRTCGLCGAVDDWEKPRQDRSHSN